MSELTLLERSLDQLTGARTLVEVDRDGYESDTIVGTIVQHSPHVVILSKLDDEYAADGVVAVRPSSITRIRFGGRELKSAAQTAAKTPVVQPFSEMNLLELTSAMTGFEQRFGHVSLHVERPGSSMVFIGQVIELDDDFIRLNQYGTRKRMDRSELLLRVDEITRVEAGGKYERSLIEAFAAAGGDQ